LAIIEINVVIDQTAVAAKEHHAKMVHAINQTIKVDQQKISSRIYYKDTEMEIY